MSSPDAAADTARTSALSSIRGLVLEAGRGSDRLSRDEAEAVFRSDGFASGLFRLFDGRDEGSLAAGDVVDLAKYNFRGTESAQLQQLLQLFESCVRLAATDDGGRVGPRELHRAVASQSLGTQVFLHLAGGGDGDRVRVDDLMRFITNMTAPASRVHLSQSDLERFAKAFRKCARSDLELTREQFQKMVSSQNKYFVDRAFKIFDRSGSGKVSLDEYTDTLSQLAGGGGGGNGAIRFLFNIYDENGDGSLVEAELREAVRASMEENGMHFDERELDDLTHALWEDAGVADGGQMTLADLTGQLEKHPDLANGLADSIVKWCSPPERTRKRRRAATAKTMNFRNYWIANRNLLVFLALFAVANASLFAYRAAVFSDFRNWDGSGPNVLVMLARANGIALNLNSMLVLVLVLRYTVTFLRKLGLVYVLPLDQHIMLHRITGMVIFAQGWFHGVMHFVNFGVNVTATPVRFLVANAHYAAVKDFLDRGLYNMPEGCSIQNVTGVLQQECEGGHSGYSYWSWMFTVSPGLFGLVPGCANITGVILIAALTIMVVGSLDCVRRSGHFEFFYFSHLLYNVYFVVLIFHAPSCWKWMIVPLIIFGLEVSFRLLSQMTGYLGQSVVTQGIVLPSKVTGLVIKKPANFRFVPGDWVFVKIPEIARAEWHPFTISSAPEEKDYFTLHIRGVGNWTRKLYNFFEEEYKRQQVGTARPVSRIDRLRMSMRGVRKTLSTESNPRGASIELVDPAAEDLDDIGGESQLGVQPFKNLRRKPSTVRYSRDEGRALIPSPDDEEGRTGNQGKAFKEQQKATLMKPLTIYLDGPFGAPASNFFRAKHAVLIATGIGVTPFSSILQSIMHRFWANKRTCPKCHYKWSDDLSNLFNLKKVDFFWINRDQRSFEWFVQLLSQLEIEQAEKGGAMERFLDMHMYMTSALQKSDMRAVGLQLALDLLHEKEKRDLVTGLKSRTKAGRPNWDKVFTELKAQNKGHITVFYCGNPALAGILQEKCEQFGFTYRKEVF